MLKNNGQDMEKYMEKYTIYCTPEQTNRAIELGASVEQEYDDFICKSFLVYPTTEEMIGWLESQDAIMEVQVNRVSVMYKTGNWNFAIFVRKDWDVILGDTVNYYHDRKTATLAAIDAALDYLEEQKNL